MNSSTNFKMIGNIAVTRLTGEYSWERVVQLMITAICDARDQHIKNLMIVVTEATGFQPPSLMMRYRFIHEMVEASGRVVRIAIVVRSEMIDPQKFGVTVAANEGVKGEIFESEDEALQWLRSLK